TVVKDVGAGVEVRRAAGGRSEAVPDGGDQALVLLLGLPGLTSCVHGGAADRSAPRQGDSVDPVVVWGPRRRGWRRWRRRTGAHDDRARHLRVRRAVVGVGPVVRERV